MGRITSRIFTLRCQECLRFKDQTTTGVCSLTTVVMKPEFRRRVFYSELLFYS